MMAGTIQAPVLQGGRATTTPSSVVMFCPQGAAQRQKINTHTYKLIQGKKKTLRYNLESIKNILVDIFKCTKYNMQKQSTCRHITQTEDSI